MVVAAGDTLSPLPDPTKVPPQDEVYQRITGEVPPPPPLKVREVLCPTHIVGTLAVAETGSVAGWFTVTVTEAQVVLFEHGAGVSYLP